MAGALADAILLLHVGIVLFVVGGQGLILLGGWRGWRWVRHRGLRLFHLALVAFIALQSWLGQLCPLTVWEQALRRDAGQAVYTESFIEHWLSRILYVQAPWWVFVLAYTAFALLVLASWRWIPPRPRAVRG
jgi:hypothetical protein